MFLVAATLLLYFLKVDFYISILERKVFGVFSHEKTSPRSSLLFSHNGNAVMSATKCALQSGLRNLLYGVICEALRNEYEIFLCMLDYFY